MANRLEALVVKENREGKAFFTKIGIAWPFKEGEGYNLILDALPTANKEGETKITLKPPLPPRQEGGGAW